MTKKNYSIIYTLFFIFSMCLGGVSFLGPISFLHIGVIVMFVAILMIDKHIYIDKYFGIYCLFVLCYILCSGLTGYLDDALAKFFSRYLVCYIGYTSTIYLVSKYKNEKLLIKLFIIIGIINAIVIFGQFLHIPIVNRLTEFLNVGDNEYLDDIEGRAEVASSFYMPGIFGVVYSGYMTMVVSILSAKYQVGRFSIMGIVISVLFLVVCFMVQERSSFAIGVVFTIYLFIKAFLGNILKKNGLRTKMVFVFLLFIAAFALIRGYETIMMGESRMAESGLELGRDDIYAKASSYISDNPIIPGIERFNAIYDTWPHNIFLNAYIYGGPIGFALIIILLIMMLAKVFPFFFKPLNKERCVLIVFGFAFFAYNINSLVHNNSLVTGDVVLWIFWGTIIALINRENRNRRAEIEMVES